MALLDIHRGGQALPGTEPILERAVAPEPARSGTARVLFGSFGWPIGTAEVASWALKTGGAEPIVDQIRPKIIWEDNASVYGPLREGPAPLFLLLNTGRADWTVPRGSELRLHDGRWRIIDPEGALGPELAIEDGMLRLIRPDALDLGLITARIHQDHARGIRDYSACLSRNGELVPELTKSLDYLDTEFVLRLMEFRPHVTGFRVDFSNLRTVAACVTAIHYLSDAFIVIGGPSATAHPREALMKTGADFGFSGEAEETFSQFARIIGHRNKTAPLTLSDYEALLGVPGLSFQYGGRIYVNLLPPPRFSRPDAAAELPASFEEARKIRHKRRPTVSSSLLNSNPLRLSILKRLSHRGTIDLPAERGCPGQCTFCGQDHGKLPRGKEAKLIFNEMNALLKAERAGTVVSRFPKDKRTFCLTGEDPLAYRPGVQRLLQEWRSHGLSKKAVLHFQTNPLSLFKREELFYLTDDTNPFQVVSGLRRAGIDTGEARRVQQEGRDSWILLTDKGRFALRRDRRQLKISCLDAPPLEPHVDLILSASGDGAIARADVINRELIQSLKEAGAEIDLGAENFNPPVLARWKKRHTAVHLKLALDALDKAGIPYATYNILADFDSTAEELIESIGLLLMEKLARPRMKVFLNPLVMPDYDSEVRQRLESRGLLTPQPLPWYYDFHPELCADPLVPAIGRRVHIALSLSRLGNNSPFLSVLASRVTLDAVEEAKQAAGEGPERERLKRLHHQVLAVHEALCCQTALEMKDRGEYVLMLTHYSDLCEREALPWLKAAFERTQADLIEYLPTAEKLVTAFTVWQFNEELQKAVALRPEKYFDRKVLERLHEAVSKLSKRVKAMLPRHLAEAV